MELDYIHYGDSYEFMESLNHRVSLILTDPPYNTTNTIWNAVPLDLRRMWRDMKRLCSGAIVFTASQPFTSKAICSNIDGFKHEWIWQKNKGSNGVNTVREPMKEHESIIVFADKKYTYNAQLELRKNPKKSKLASGMCVTAGKRKQTTHSNYGQMRTKAMVSHPLYRCPGSVQKWDVVTKGRIHPTQKPLEMMRYLVRTYSNPGDVVLDPFCGSGVVLMAAKLEGRAYIGCDKNFTFYKRAKARMKGDS